MWCNGNFLVTHAAVRGSSPSCGRSASQSARWCSGNILASHAAVRGSSPGCGRSASQLARWCNGNILASHAAVRGSSPGCGSQSAEWCNGNKSNRLNEIPTHTHKIWPIKTHTNSPSSKNRRVVHIQDLTECLDRMS